jgi:hypothetical protein
VEAVITRPRHFALLAQLSPRVGHLLQILRYDLLRGDETLHEIRRVLLLIGLDERDRRPGLAGATGATDTMHVVLVVVRHFVIDDEGEILHIEAACNDGGGDHDRANLALEIGDGELAIQLIHTTVQCGTRITGIVQLSKEMIDRLLLIDEDENALIQLIPLAEYFE